MTGSSSVITLNRLVDVLDCFSPERPLWSLAQLSAHLAIPKSTLHRFILGLESQSILRRDAGDRRWRLGYHLVIWGSLAGESTTLRDLAMPVMRQLVADSGETAILTVYHEGEVICTELCETSQPVRLHMSVGARRPAHAGASSKVLMAYLPDGEIETIIHERGLSALCTNTITDPERLQAELARIRRLGYGVSLEETDHDAWGVATPIRDWRQRVVAAVGLAGPTTRYSEDKIQQWVDLCRQAAARITTRMRQDRESETPAQPRQDSTSD